MGVVIINETAARRIWPNQDPAGQLVTVHFRDQPATFRVVGVARDVLPD